MKDLSAHHHRTSGASVKVEKASDDDIGPLTHIPCGGGPGLNAREIRTGEKGME